MIKFIKSLKRNMLFVLKIEILALFLYTYVIFPLCNMLLERVMRSQGYGYFFDSNIRGIVQNVWIILALMGIGLLLGICFYLEIMILINALLDGNQSMKSILKKSLYSIKRLISPYGLLLILISFFISVIIHFNLLTRIIQNLGLVEYVRKNLLNNMGFTIVVIFSLILFIILFLRYLFVYPILASEYVSVKKSFSLSVKFMKGKYIRTLLKLILVNVLSVIFFSFLYLLILLVVVLIIKSSVIINLQYATSMTVMDTVNRLLVFFYSTAMVVINLESSVILSKSYSIYEPYIFNEINFSLNDKKIKRKKRGIWTLVILISLIFYIIINSNFLHNFRLRTGYNPEGKRTEIFAHRGNSYKAPENTLSALESAIEEKADGAEIDVRMTKDGEIILMHDSSLKRTAGINEQVSRLEYSQLTKLDVGTWFSPEFEGERIPTLREALELCKGRLTLMIEVKSDKKKEDQISQKIVEHVEDMNMDQDVIIASFNLNVLKEVKRLNNKIATCLIIRFAYGNIDEMEDVDMFSIESRFLQSSVLKSIKNSDKALAVWTVNEGSRIASLRDMGIDAVITDHPVKAREIFYENAVPGFLSHVISSILK